MKQQIRMAGLVLASLTVATVALAQQGGGGRGGEGGGGDGGGDNSVIALRLQDHERAEQARLSRARTLHPGARPGANCLTHACADQDPPRHPPARMQALLPETCGTYRLLRDEFGRFRRVCDRY